MSEEANSESEPNLLSQLSDKLQERVKEEFSPIIGSKNDLRGKLVHAGVIHTVDSSQYPQVKSMASVDGARVQEKLYAADFLGTLVTMANSLDTPEKPVLDQIIWADIMQHTDGTDRVAQTSMGSGEVTLLAKIPHEVRIMDGSLVTPLIMLREGLFVKSSKVQDRSADILAKNDTAALLGHLIDFAPEGLVSLAKSDSANYFSKDFDERFGLRFPMQDRFLATQILEPGEMFEPRGLHELGRQTVDVPNSSNPLVVAQAGLLKVQYERLAKMSREGLIYTTYYRPTVVGENSEHSPKNVVRIEFSIKPNDIKNVIEIAKKYAATINSDMKPPYILEPYAQYTVDKLAKGISGLMRSLQADMMRRLPEDQQAAYGELLMRPYRS
jgi:hypothetical protein